MKIKLNELKAQHLRQTGERITNAIIEKTTGIASPALTRYANGSVKRINTDHADSLTTFWRQRGFSLEEIWHFGQLEQATPQRFYGKSRNSDCDNYECGGYFRSAKRYKR